MTIENKENLIVETNVKEEVKKKTNRGRKSTKTTNVQEVKSKSKATVEKELKKYAKDIDVEITSLIGGDIIYKSERNDLDNISIDGVGGTTVVSLALLIDMCKKKENLLSNLSIAIKEVYNDEYKLDDILELLKVKDLYIFEEMTIEYLDDFLINIEKNVFEEKFNSIPSNVIKNRLIERSVALYRDGLLDSNYKLNVLEGYANNEYLYKNI